MSSSIKITECPRDAMQGIMEYIPAKKKAIYLNSLLKVGFDTLDFGSFVSPKAVPQLADTAEVLSMLELPSATRLLAVVANLRGAEEAVRHSPIHYLGYPFSISETFQLRNTRKTIAESLKLVREMYDLCGKNGKTLLVYISMGFGNPYGDPWSPEIAENWVSEMYKIGIREIALADTVGSADAKRISGLFKTLLPAFPAVEFGAHFHATPQLAREKINAAWEAGCRKFDVAMQGFGGCPFAEDDLVGNIATETLLAFLEEKGVESGLDREAFKLAFGKAGELFKH